MAPPRTDTLTRTPSSTLGFVLLAIGVWLTVASYVLGYEDAGKARVVESALGAALIVLAVLRLLAKDLARFVPAAVTMVGVGLVIGPAVVRYGYLERPVLAYVNSIVLGLVVIALGVLLGKRQKAE